MSSLLLLSSFRGKKVINFKQWEIRIWICEQSSMLLHQWLPLVAYTGGHLINTLVFLESFLRLTNLDPLTNSSPFRFPYQEETRVSSFSARFHWRASLFYRRALRKPERDGAEKLSLSRNIPLAVKSLALFLAIGSSSAHIFTIRVQNSFFLNLDSA